MSLCTSCRLALRQTIRQQPIRLHAASLSTRAKTTSTTTSPTPDEILSKPTWSIRTLREPLPPDTPSQSPSETITIPQLHHLLRLAALPLPKTSSEEDAMISTLQSQLQFVRTVQRVNTEGVKPLSAIQDETEAAVRESTIGLKDLKALLDKEEHVGHYKRPRRVKEKIESEAENWDALGNASRKAGRYFVVESASKEDTS